MGVSRTAGLLAALWLLSACGGRDEADAPDAANEAAPAAPAEAADSAGAGSEPSRNTASSSSSGWDLSSGGDGATLALVTASGGTALRLFCPSGRDELRLHVSGFRPVGSEERMTFGSGGAAHTLVADPGTSGGGVRASGAVPDDLPALIGGPVSVNYGSQDSGPHAAPPSDLARRFVSACRAGAPAQDAANSSVSACLIQDGKRLTNPPLRVVGTEPFWAARTKGRCVTYSHPQDQDGTRVWTTYRPGPDGGGTWSGALGDRLFELNVRPRPRCSDGMSDKRDPFEAEVKVHGEIRRGCAEPLPPG